MRKIEKAWLIRWKRLNACEYPNDKEYIAIYDGDANLEFIKKFIELYYATIYYNNNEMINSFCDDKKEIKYPAYILDNNINKVACGHNPYICAELVDNLFIKDNDEIIF